MNIEIHSQEQEVHVHIDHVAQMHYVLQRCYNVLKTALTNNKTVEDIGVTFELSVAHEAIPKFEATIEDAGKVLEEIKQMNPYFSSYTEVYPDGVEFHLNTANWTIHTEKE